MKAAESKTTSARSAQTQEQTQQPFFQKDGQGSFFSEKTQQEQPFFSPKTIQPKLTIGKPGDKYEQEADATADKVVQRLAQSSVTGSESTVSEPSTARHTPAALQMKCAECEQEEQNEVQEEGAGAPELQRKAIFESNEDQPAADVQTKLSGSPPVQAKCDTCEQEEQLQKMDEPGAEEEPAVQAKSDAPPPDATPDLQTRLNNSRGGGQSLPATTRGSMESAFGADFSGVRVHTGSEAVQMSQELGAQAFTHGSDIYFNSGKYDTGSTGGKKLLAHELTHTVQQKNLNLKHEIQLSRLRDYVSNSNYEPIDSEIKKTNEYQAYTNQNLVWQTELAMTDKEAILACRLILKSLKNKESVDWNSQARIFALTAKEKIAGENNPSPAEEEESKICGPDVTSWLIAQMRNNGASSTTGKLRELNNSWNPINWAEALTRWYFLVRTGGPWDFKTLLGRPLTVLFTACRQNCTGKLWSIALAGKCMTYEAAANIHYGFVGRMAGFSESRLLKGASSAQTGEGRGETQDDPRDVEAIKVGFNLFDQGDPGAFSSGELTSNHYENLPEGDGDPEGCEVCDESLTN